MTYHNNVPLTHNQQSTLSLPIRHALSHHTILYSLPPFKLALAQKPPPQSSQLTISPHTTACRSNPLYSLPVKNPSLPATRSLQSVVISCSIDPASCVCEGEIPNMMHFPMRVRTSESQRGLRAAVAGTDADADAEAEAVDCRRAWGDETRWIC